RGIQLVLRSVVKTVYDATDRRREITAGVVSTSTMDRRAARMGVSDQIYETLKREIMDLVLEPNAPLSETGLVSRLGGSRTSVRQALQRLGSEGLVRTVPGRGAFVSEIST